MGLSSGKRSGSARILDSTGWSSFPSREYPGGGAGGGDRVSMRGGDGFPAASIRRARESFGTAFPTGADAPDARARHGRRSALPSALENPVPAPCAELSTRRRFSSNFWHCRWQNLSNTFCSRHFCSNSLIRLAAQRAFDGSSCNDNNILMAFCAKIFSSFRLHKGRSPASTLLARSING